MGRKLTVGSLFSGIGGFDLGLERAGMEIKWQVEIDPFCRKVLEKHWPHVRRYEDVRNVYGYCGEYMRGPKCLELIDVLCGGFPCQPVSVAGKRRAHNDHRWLWPEFARIIRELEPRYVVVENVPGLLTAGFGTVLGDLAALGLDAEWESIPARAVGAPHKRERVWIVAYPSGSRLEKRSVFAGGRRGSRGAFSRQDALMAGDVSDAYRWRREECAQFNGASSEDTANWDSCRRYLDGCDCASWWATEPDVGRVAHGVPARVDRLRGLGNAVVPQIAQWIGERIIEAEAQRLVTGGV